MPGPLAPTDSAVFIRDVIQWDVATWSRCLPFWAARVEPKPARSATVLTLGERHGGISLWFALQGYSVVCTDLIGPTARGLQLHESYGVQSRIRYVSANALALPFPDTTFDIVAAKSVLGGIKLKRGSVKTGSLSAARAATKEIHRVLQPNGSFLGAENMVGSLAHQAGRALRSHQTRWWLYLTDDDLGTLFESFSLVEREYYGCLGTHWGHTAANAWAATIDRFVCPLLPRSSLYVGFVRARK